MKPAEITKTVLANRIDNALKLLGVAHDGITGELLVGTTQFDDLCGVVEKATQVERLRAGHTARRLGHSQTGRVIMEGK